MAEAVVSLAIDKLVLLLTQEVTLLKGVHKEVAVIKDDLEAIRAFLKDADSKAEREVVSSSVNLWVKKAREVAYQIEDVIDEYMLQLAQHRDRSFFVRFLHKISSMVMKLKPRHEIASKIQDISKALQKIKDRSEAFRFSSSEIRASSANPGNVILHDPRLASLSIEEAELVDTESLRDELISHLVSEASHRRVIAVVGLGGVGKTTLARKVYDNHQVKRHFGCYAWITVSHSYDRKQLLSSLLREFCKVKNEVPPQDIDMMDDSLLINKLREYLHRKKFLVVFDDVWEVGFWEDVEHALLDNDNGSRILITTRNEAVADFCRRSSLVHLHQVKPLNEQGAWELFCKKAFKFEFERKCPKDLEGLSYNIVRRCGGLPLAIVAVGGLLATKEKVVQEWKKLLDNLSSVLTSDPHLVNVTKILSLSYGDLPYNLKSCMLHLGMFPEDTLIKRTSLIRLWVAGGSVQGKQGKTLEEVADEYLTELIHRNLIQVRKIGGKGIPRTCQVHDLVREVILSKSEELSFCHVSSNSAIFEGISRHLVISNKGIENPKSSTKSQARSIIVFQRTKLPEPMFRAIFQDFKLLSTLRFDDCPIDHIPKEIGNLVHLKFLSLRYTKVSKLPKSIGKLQKLECLDLRDSSVRQLPVGIGKFPKLHNFLCHALRIHGSIRQLEFLHRLSGLIVDDDDDGMRLINELTMLKQLRKLGVFFRKSKTGKRLCMALEKMPYLRSLKIGSGKGVIPEVQSISSPPDLLQSLELGGRLERLPDWISKLHNLAKLRLVDSKLTDDPMKALQALPNLKYLSLTNYGGEKLHSERGGFQKLKWLHLQVLYELSTMVIDEGAMPQLEQLRIGGCPRMKEVPSGIQHLKHLKTLRFAGMSNEFNQMLSQDQGGGYQIVKHVPNLQYDSTYDLNDETSYAAWLRRRCTNRTLKLN